jgi:hypothetical protein
MSIKDYDAFKVKNKHLERYYEEAPLVSFTPQGDFRSKTDNTWKEVLSKISEKHPASELAKEHGKRTIKEAKTRQIFDKHIKKAQQKTK